MSLLTKAIIVFFLCAMSYFAGCSHQDAAEIRTETKFIQGKERIVEVEKRVEVPRFVQTVTTIETTKEKLIEAAKHDTPNPDACDLAPSRVLRVNEAIRTANPVRVP